MAVVTARNISVKNKKSLNTIHAQQCTFWRETLPCSGTDINGRGWWWSIRCLISQGSWLEGHYLWFRISWHYAPSVHECLYEVRTSTRARSYTLWHAITCCTDNDKNFNVITRHIILYYIKQNNNKDNNCVHGGRDWGHFEDIYIVKINRSSESFLLYKPGC